VAKALPSIIPSQQFSTNQDSVGIVQALLWCNAQRLILETSGRNATM